jgi:hypothetical protein
MDRCPTYYKHAAPTELEECGFGIVPINMALLWSLKDGAATAIVSNPPVCVKGCMASMRVGAVVKSSSGAPCL